jgi:monothiol glutaredoxin
MPQKDANMSIEQFIDNEVKSNDVVLFMKGTPQFPQCGFSGQVVQILDHVGGCDIIREMFQSGELQQLLADKGVVVSAAASA